MREAVSHATRPHQLPLERLTAAAFSPFGDVLEPLPPGHGRHRLDSFSLASPTAKTQCWISTFQPSGEATLVFEQFEAHPHSAQAFVALQPSRFVVVVAESDPATKLPDIATARAFLADQVAGIVYRPGVWHAGMMVLEAAASFFVVQGLVESGNDATAPLPQPMVIVDPTRPQ